MITGLRCACQQAQGQYGNEGLPPAGRELRTALHATIFLQTGHLVRVPDFRQRAALRQNTG